MILVIGPLLAIVGLVGGIRHKAVGTIVFGLLGTLLNLLAVGAVLASMLYTSVR